MLSVLIPTYNHKVLPLVTALNSELLELEIPYEILVFDDGSTKWLEENKKVGEFPKTTFRRYEQNKGRSAIRNALASSAKYTMLLFLDADVMPVSTTFIGTYVQTIKTNKANVIYGGVAYNEEKPPIENRLRWEYGSNREVQAVSERQKRPHFVITQNVAIQKEVYLNLNIPTSNFYGDDLVFSQELKRKQIEVLHIHNPVYHLGLETSQQYLEKALSAVKSIVALEKKGGIDNDFTKLQQTYLKIKKSGGLGIFKWFIAPKKQKMEQNFLSEKPNLRWFDLYRLLYYIELKSDPNA